MRRRQIYALLSKQASVAPQNELAVRAPVVLPDAAKEPEAVDGRSPPPVATADARARKLAALEKARAAKAAKRMEAANG